MTIKRTDDDPLQFVFDALAAATNDGPQPSPATVIVLQSTWRLLSPADKIELLSFPAIISLLSEHSDTAAMLLTKVEQLISQYKSDCESAGFSFCWDPEGYYWHFPLDAIQASSSLDLTKMKDIGLSTLSGFGSDIVAVIFSAHKELQTAFEHFEDDRPKPVLNNERMRIATLMKGITPTIHASE